MSFQNTQTGVPAHELNSQSAQPIHDMNSQQNIEPAPPVYHEATSNYNEKSQHANQQQGIPQEHMSQEAHKGAVPQQGGPPANNYQFATPLASLQQGPAPVDCPACGRREMTRTQFVSGGTTHLSALLCCCCLCLGCIPYLASWFKDCEHLCGNCGTLLAVWHRSGRTEVMAHSTTTA